MAMAVVYTTFAGQIVSENRGGVVKEYLTDTLGSTIALATTDAITDTWDYWPHGEEMSRTGTTPTPFTFVGVLGYFKDLLDKLFYVRARHYQPNYGRWLTVDPLWPRASSYSYVRANPSGAVDPTGLFAWIPVLCAAACAGCLICLAGFISSCTWCGSDVACWYACLQGVLDDLPWWAKGLCALACAGCLLCIGRWLIRPRPRPNPAPETEPGPNPCSSGLSKYALCILLYTSAWCNDLVDPIEFVECFSKAHQFCKKFLPPGGGGGEPIPVPEPIAA